MRFLLAVSGGIDSMYLLHRAPELFPGASFAVAHCNFALRGEDSDGDEAFVRAVCDALGIKCFVRRFDTLGYAAGHGVSVEMAARELRYEWFSSLCRENGFDALVTAHNANDNAETLILNLLRGTGTKGLRGIPAAANNRRLEVPHGAVAARDHVNGRGPQDADRSRGACSEADCPQTVGGMSAEREDPGGTSSGDKLPPEVYRPLLETTREEIRKWMTEKGFEWREDRTNAENGPKRNKIRNQVFPVFAEINPSFIKTLGADMERFRQTDDIAEDYYAEAAQRIVKQSVTSAEISVPDLLALKHWRYVLWRILEDRSFSAETFDKLCTLLDRYRTEPSGTVTLSGKTFQSPAWLLRARKKSLILIPR